MRRNSIFWGVLVILAGIILLLSNLGLLPVDAWKLIWPLALVLLGLWFLVAPRLRSGKMETQQLSIPAEAVRQAKIKFEHGAGRLDISGLAAADTLVSGTFGGGVDSDVSRNGDEAKVKLSAPVNSFPFDWVGPNQGYVWQVSLNPDVTLELFFGTGASESHLDLSNLHVSDVKLETGASSTDLILPERAGFTRVDIHAGAASVNIRLPQGVAARINVKSGLAGIKIDNMRFPPAGNGFYQSTDYGTAANRADIYVETGVGSIDVR